MNRPIIIAGNWKMHKTRAQAIELAQEIVQFVAEKTHLPEVILFPPFTSIEYVSTTVTGTKIAVGAQNMSQHASGAYTGEVSAEMLLDCGATTVLLGHSERRHIFQESNSTINAKLKTALKFNLVPVLCVGETIEERKAKHTDTVIKEQLVSALESIDASELKRLVIAYEPVWAIGTGEVCEAAEANRVASEIRSILSTQSCTKSCCDTIPILYGGSVKPSNIKEILSQSNIDGVLVGGASLTASDFVPLIEAGMKSAVRA